MFTEELTLRRQLIEIANRCVAMDLVLYAQGNFSTPIDNRMKL